ncbi:MAG: hypothetical protein PHI68_02495 [Candidatus Cloacimonetes bacterium]|nr:hypothetical protein [Candidatus Cloacimonadota bacterium]
MRRHLLLLILLPLLLLFACSEKDDKTPTDTNIYGYKLEQFVAKNVVNALIDEDAPEEDDYRDLYAYEIVSADDGFSPRESAYAGYDLSWGAFREGYIVPSDNNRTYFADPSLPGAFKVRNAGIFRLYRKIDVETMDRGSKSIELKGLTLHQVENWDGIVEDAIKLSDLLQGIASYDSVQIICFDGYGEAFSYPSAAIEDGYYLLGTERTIFPTATLPNNQKKMKKVHHLIVWGSTTAQEHEFELTPHDLTDLELDVPESFSGFQSTVLEGYGTK